MLRKMLVLMVAGMMGVYSASMTWAGNRGTSPPAEDSSVAERSGRGAFLPSGRPHDEGSYLIGPGDVLDIAVWRDDALTRSCAVRPDGFISFPLIGDVRAAGRTASELKADLASRLAPYVPGVTLSLEIKQINSMIIYVVGRVNSPGRQVLNIDVNVMQALATAGGLNPFANRNQIKILRQGSTETTIFPFEYDDVINGKHLEQNIYLKRGDVIVVP